METKLQHLPIRVFLFIGFLFLFGVTGSAQPYPVTSNIQLVGSTLPKLDAFQTRNSNKLFYTMILNDQTASNYDVRLRLTISGRGITMRTDSRYLPPPIRLQYNVPRVLTSVDLADFFDLNNLEFTGMTKQEYLTRGLPEGTYSVCLEAFDYLRSNDPAIANNTCATTALILQDPPRILQPIGNQIKNDPLSMTLSWQPQHTFIPSPTYQMEIFEVPPGLTDDQVLTSTAPIFQQTTQLTQYQYGLIDPLLRLDQDYIFRVRVIDPSRGAYVKNDGYSMIERFRIIIPCIQGHPCSDGDPCTYNDAITLDCKCVGTPWQDSDGDGVCDLRDICPGGNDNIDTDSDGIPDDCDICNVGASCDDGDECTTGDMIQGDCECWGLRSLDTDNDGICDAVDDCILGPNSEDADSDGIADVCDDCIEGTPCDDGDPTTINDRLVWNSDYTPGEPIPNWIDACQCKGTPTPCDSGDDDGDGICNDRDKCPDFDDNIDSDNDGTPDGCEDCNDNFNITASLSESEEVTCDYCFQLGQFVIGQFMVITGLAIELPDGREAVISGVTPGFDFPYCTSNASCFGTSSDLSDMANDLTQWLINEGHGGVADWETYKTLNPRCYTKGMNSFVVSGSRVKFLKSYGFTKSEELTVLDFEASNCVQTRPATYSLSANVDAGCANPTFLWSNGETDASIKVEGDPSSYSVEVACANGCTYSSDDLTCILGMPCDDGSACTINETYNALCMCVGDYVGDQDNDGACDPLDLCPGGNDYLDADGDGTPDACFNCKEGEPCDDGDPCTIDEEYDQDCNCIGKFQDDDNDSVCNAYDQCPGFPDYHDMDMDGIPDGCETRGCVAQGPNGSCQLVKRYCDCENIRKIPLNVLSKMYFQHYFLNANQLDSLTLEESGDDINFEMVDLEGTPLVTVLNLSKIGYYHSVSGEAIMRDSDFDGVCDLFDMCPGGHDMQDSNGNCIPDACENDCNRDFSLQLQIMFDRDCDDGNDCTINDQIQCDCNCMGVISDLDGDGVCDENDLCQGFDDTQDIDGDGIPDGCDYNPCTDSSVITPCDDGDPCTTGDREIIDPNDPTQCICQGTPDLDTDNDGVCDNDDQCHGWDDSIDTDGDGIPDGCDLCENSMLAGNIGEPCDDENVCTIMDVLSYLYDEDGNVVGCDCIGQEYDADNDGVCDPLDKCPGWNDLDDYDDDEIPDGCDPRWYEIGCPEAVQFAYENAHGIILFFNVDDVRLEDVPNPIDITVLYKITSEPNVYSEDRIELTSYRTVNGQIEAYYEVLGIDMNAIGNSSNTQLTVSYSEHQSCTFIGKGFNIVNPIDIEDLISLPCPSQFSINAEGNLVLELPQAPLNPINFNDVPETVDLALTIAPGEQINVTANIVNMDFESLKLKLWTDVPVANVSNPSGSVTFPGGPACGYTGGAIDTPAGCAHYPGEPCDDLDSLTHSDAYDANCQCYGQLGHDQDGDGVHDLIDRCPGHPDDVDVDGNGVPDGCECTLPVIVSAEVVNGNDIEVILEPNDDHQSYKIRYYVDTPPGDSVVRSTLPLTVPNVLTGYTYTLEVIAVCTDGHPSNPTVIQVDVPFDPDAFYCGLPPAVDLSNQVPLEILRNGDAFRAGDFMVTVDKVQTGYAGKFTGTGFIEVPYLNFVRVNVTFQGIFINDEYVMVDGNVIVTGIGAAIISEELAELLQDIVDGLEQAADILEQLADALEQLEIIVAQMQSMDDYFNNGENIVQNILNIANEIPCLPESATDSIEMAVNCFASASQESDFAGCKQILEDGIAKLKRELAELYDADYQIVFERKINQNFGFDTLQHIAFKDEYSRVTIADESYNIAWKSIKSGDGTDQVVAKLKGGGSFPSNEIAFKDANDNVVPTTVDGEKRLLQLAGKTHEDITQIYAVQTPSGTTDKHIAGQIGVISYNEKPLDISLVSVNGVTYPYNVNDLTAKLNAIYKQAVVPVSVSLHPDNLVVSDFDNIMDDIPSSSNRGYTYEMEDIIETFDRLNTVDPDRYYLFLVNASDDVGKLGTMPFGRNFGFIFNGNISSEDEYVKTIAHELGHGAFYLQHTFDEYDELEEGDTDNLMDYGADLEDASLTGKHLHKHQWDKIHDPGASVELFEDDDTEYITINFLDSLSSYVVDGALTFINNLGGTVSIPYDNLLSLTFATGGEQYLELGSMIPIGSLTFFKLKTGQSYMNCADGNYYLEGETCEVGDEYYYSYPQSSPKKAVIIRPCYINGISAINVVDIEESNFPTPSTSTANYDLLLPYFFAANNDNYTDLRYVHQGKIMRVTSAENKFFSLSPEFRYPLYRRFIESYGEYAEYDKISSFYVNSLALVLHKYSSNYQECDEWGEVLKLANISELLNRFNLENDPDGRPIELEHYTPPATEGADFDELRFNGFLNLIESLNFFEGGGDYTEAQAFNFISFYLNRTYLMQGYQDWINSLGPEDAETYFDVIKNAEYQLMPCEYASLNFNYPLLKSLIRYIVDHNEIWLDNDEEWLILKLLDKIGSENYSDFLSYLESTNLEAQTPSDSWLWNTLIERVDDSWLDKNGTKFMRKIVDMFTYSRNETNSFIYQRWEDLMGDVDDVESDNMADTVTVATMKKATIPVIPYNYTNVLQRIAPRFSTMGNRGVSIPMPNPYLLTDVNLDEDDGDMDIITELKFNILVPGYTVESISKKDVKPFDLLIVDRSSSFGVTKEFTRDSNFLVVPACLFYFFNEKAISKSTKDIIITSLDIASLALPAGPLVKLVRVGKYLVYADRASSILSIASTLTSETEYQKYSDILGAASAFLGLTDLTWRGVTKYKVMKVNKTFDKLVESVSKSKIDNTMVEKANDFTVLLNSIINASDLSIDALKLSDKRVDELARILSNEDAFALTRGGVPLVDPQLVSTALSRIGRTNFQDLENALRILTAARGFPESALVSKIMQGLSLEDAGILSTILHNQPELVEAFHKSVNSGGDDLVDVWKSFKAAGEEVGSVYHTVFDQWSNTKRATFLGNLGDGLPELRKIFKDNPTAIDVWDFLRQVDSPELAMDAYAVGKIFDNQPLFATLTSNIDVATSFFSMRNLTYANNYKYVSDPHQYRIDQQWRRFLEEGSDLAHIAKYEDYFSVVVETGIYREIAKNKFLSAGTYTTKVQRALKGVNIFFGTQTITINGVTTTEPFIAFSGGIVARRLMAQGITTLNGRKLISQPPRNNSPDRFVLALETHLMNQLDSEIAVLDELMRRLYQQNIPQLDWRIQSQREAIKSLIQLEELTSLMNPCTSCGNALDDVFGDGYAGSVRFGIRYEDRRPK
ncbi:MAG: hypothetical protein AAF990_06460 [Bacteroidota bacterium]